MSLTTTSTTSSTPLNITPTIGGSAAKLDKAHSDLMKASQQFESYFINEMLKEMRKTVPTDDDIMGGSNNDQQIFTDMADQAVADSVSKQGSFGIAKMLYSQLSKSLPPNNPADAASAAGSSAAGKTVSLIATPPITGEPIATTPVEGSPIAKTPIVGTPIASTPIEAQPVAPPSTIEDPLGLTMSTSAATAAAAFGAWTAE